MPSGRAESRSHDSAGIRTVVEGSAKGRKPAASRAPERTSREDSLCVYAWHRERRLRSKQADSLCSNGWTLFVLEPCVVRMLKWN